MTDSPEAVEAWSREDLVATAKRMALITGCAISGVFFAYYLRFSHWPELPRALRTLIFGFESDKQFAAAQEAWSQFGEFVGGTLGPVLSGLTFIAMVFTLLLQQEAIFAAKKDSANTLKALSDQTWLSLEAARLQALTAALAVTSEELRQVQNTHLPGCTEIAEDLTKRKGQLAGDIIEINDRLALQAKAKTPPKQPPPLPTKH
jgi:hypothetical protein